jgi:hypothetical protein
MGERIGGLWEVTDGLQASERVIVQGVQKVREGASVIVKEWTPPAKQVAAETSAPPKER